jgi:hypothetical protein
MKYLYYCLLVFLIGCGHDNGKDADASSKDSYSDGKYCADVTYYNANTGTRHTYTLNVEVENNEMIKIYWGNGGWLDDSHFSPQELDKNGSCSFTSDRGYQYEIEITGSECTSTDSPESDAENEKQVFTLTLGQCASAMQMTERELAEYENTFHVNRADIISDKMCDLMREYIIKSKPLKEAKKELDRQIENGYIQTVYSRSEGDDIICQQTIVKRKAVYYWLEVRGTSKTTMGLMEFNPDIPGWQDVIVKEDPSISTMQVFSMRIMDQSADMGSLKVKMENYCN